MDELITKETVGAFLVFGGVGSLLAQSRGREPLLWFFVVGALNILGLILLLHLPVLERVSTLSYCQQRQLSKELKKDEKLRRIGRWRNKGASNE